MAWWRIVNEQVLRRVMRSISGAVLGILQNWLLNNKIEVEGPTIGAGGEVCLFDRSVGRLFGKQQRRSFPVRGGSLGSGPVGKNEASG